MHPVGSRDVVRHPLERHPEAPRLTFEHVGFVEIDEGRQKVLGRGVLFEPAHEVADRGIEFTWVHDRGVEQNPTGVGAHRVGERRSHAEQHFELDPPRDAATFREEVREGEVEQVVAGDADAHGVGVLRVEGDVEHPLVVRVGLGFAAPGREWPAVHGGIHSLHREVRALHDAHLDARTPRSDPCACPAVSDRRAGRASGR